ncbi:2-succinyl-6-hydroxy-2,4-cyclohexadiene-1-carboxylate synthase [uncultured Veillonella sp.]|uniref:2-succinyl-6-hydroxy-2, 4-cyclohexadiene-1-carboxylate synthase n=1 Tax=uncultured Veillonella sp. TaxID=159268 RepID=UPI002619E963|nr:2-succinyl-6-hydroxy-2,4-cyclohexadiene-1-carboxylate synthase [uncultured Veillonella sp.]
MNDELETLDEIPVYDQGERAELDSILHDAEDVFVTIDTVSYHVLLRGEGFPLICLHGFSEACDTWQHLNLPGFRLYCIDFLGHGFSDRPNKSNLYEFNTALRHLYTLIHTLVGDEPYGMLGYSMGGRMALQYAAMYEPERLAFLILESASPGIEHMTERGLRMGHDEKLAKAIESHSIQWFEELWSSLPIFSSQQTLPETVQESIKRRRLSNEPYVLAHTLRGTGQGKTPYVGDSIEKLGTEILYIAGEYDAKYMEFGTHVFAPCGNVSFVSVPQAGHNVHIEKPKEFNDIVDLFLSDFSERSIS